MKYNLLLLFVLITGTSFAQKIMLRDSIPLLINEQNTISIKAVFNNLDTLNLNFDTGTTELVITNDVLKNKLKSATKLYNTIYNLKIGNTDYKTKVYDAELSGHGTDGRFGWDLFKDKIVELNYDKNLLVIHSELPKKMISDKKFSKLKMTFLEELFFIENEIAQNGVINKELFLFDTGYQRTLMLDKDLLQEKKFPIEKMEVLKKVIMHGAQGNEIPVITSNLKTFKIGKYKLKNIPVQITNANKPFKNKDIHILGNELLKRFNVFLDFQNHVVYLKPNRYFNDNYIEQKKNT